MIIVREVIEKCEATEPDTVTLTGKQMFDDLATQYDMINSTSTGGCYNMATLSTDKSYEFHCSGPAIGWVSIIIQEPGKYEFHYTREDTWSDSCPVDLVKNNRTVGTVPVKE